MMSGEWAGGLRRPRPTAPPPCLITVAVAPLSPSGIRASVWPGQWRWPVLPRRPVAFRMRLSPPSKLFHPLVRRSRLVPAPRRLSADVPMSLSLHLFSWFPAAPPSSGSDSASLCESTVAHGAAGESERAFGVVSLEQPHLPLAGHRLGQDAVRFLAGQRIDGPRAVLLGGVHPAV
jgi:hypothetical protein